MVGMIRVTELICRRGDSNPHELPHTPLKRARLPVPPLRLVREGCQKLWWPAHRARDNRARTTVPLFESSSYFFFVGAGDGVSTVDVGNAAGAAGVGVAGAGVGVGTCVCSGTPDCRTEPVPVIHGNERIMAISIKATAAPIVIFESSVCVPRGPNAVLETELEKSAPASALPGCNRIVTTRITHDRMNSP